jgi:hypothetical protein
VYQRNERGETVAGSAATDFGDLVNFAIGRQGSSKASRPVEQFSSKQLTNCETEQACVG